MNRARLGGRDKGRGRAKRGMVIWGRAKRCGEAGIKVRGASGQTFQRFFRSFRGIVG